MDLTAEQIEKLKSLGINVDNQPAPSAETPVPQPTATQPEPVLQPSPQTPEIQPEPKIETPPLQISKDKKPIAPVVPLLSISGLTILSFGGVILFKSKNSASLPPQPQPSNFQTQSPGAVTPTQVPKSIQHYLLTSQQYFSSALQLQNGVSTTPAENSPQQVVNLLNQSIIAASDAIKEFPTDSRGYYQRAKIYQSLVNSQPQLLDQTIADLNYAYKLNPNSADITRDLASAYARKGDAQDTITYLAATVSLDPTKAQNFYDLARIQQQAGLVSQALETYNRLLPLITDANQKSQVESEKATLEKIIAQNPNFAATQNSSIPSPSPSISLPDNPPTIQAMGSNTGLIIAAPETGKKIEVENVTDSNALSGNTVLPANQQSISIENKNITNTSQVYVTITSGGKNQTLQVLSKTPGSFTVGLDNSIGEDINFKWWIIN